MSKFDWKKLVGTVAPTLATALGGPLAGIAVKTIATQVLGKPEASEAEVEAALAGADPQTLLKLKEIDAEFKQAMLNAGVKFEEIAAADRASARNREIVTGDHWTPRLIAIGVLLLCIGLEGYVMVKGLPTGVSEVLVGRILGTLDSAALMVLAYYFGSSAGGRAKDETIAHIAKMP